MATTNPEITIPSSPPVLTVYASILRELGEDPAREGLSETAGRVAKALQSRIGVVRRAELVRLIS